LLQHVLDGNVLQYALAPETAFTRQQIYTTVHVHCCMPQVESSLATQYPSLLSLGVASGYDKYNEDTAPEAVAGLYKVLPNKQWPSGKVVSGSSAWLLWCLWH
jgi:hypothetical protein